MKSKGQGSANLAIMIATMAIVLVVVVIVVANLIGNLNVGLSGSALAAYNNITNYTWLFSTAQHC